MNFMSELTVFNGQWLTHKTCVCYACEFYEMRAASHTIGGRSRKRPSSEGQNTRAGVCKSNTLINNSLASPPGPVLCCGTKGWPRTVVE